MNQLKVVAASQADIYKFKNLKEKLLKTNANIYFNKQCLTRQITPNFIKTKAPFSNHTQKQTKIKIQKLQLKDEIKFLYAKKQNINKQLLHLHLKLAHTWGKLWPYIEETLNSNLSLKFLRCKAIIFPMYGLILGVGVEVVC